MTLRLLTIAMKASNISNILAGCRYQGGWFALQRRRVREQQQQEEQEEEAERPEQERVPEVSQQQVEVRRGDHI